MDLARACNFAVAGGVSGTGTGAMPPNTTPAPGSMGQAPQGGLTYVCQVNDDNDGRGRHVDDCRAFPGSAAPTGYSCTGPVSQLSCVIVRCFRTDGVVAWLHDDVCACWRGLAHWCCWHWGRDGHDAYGLAGSDGQSAFHAEPSWRFWEWGCCWTAGPQCGGQIASCWRRGCGVGGSCVLFVRENVLR